MNESPPPEREPVPTNNGEDEAREVGVGPWAGPWPEGTHYDPELLAHGDRRNVLDRYRYWRREAIVADLDTVRHPFHVAVENWTHDFNIGSVVRTANAFNCAGVHIVGRRRWNKRGAMVTDRYQHVYYHPDSSALLEWACENGLPLVGVDNLPGSVPLESYPLPRSVVLVFGQEGPGLSEETRRDCQAVLSIAQFGSTRSINAGAAAAISMHAWVRAHVFDQSVEPAGAAGGAEAAGAGAVSGAGEPAEVGGAGGATDLGDPVELGGFDGFGELGEAVGFGGASGSAGSDGNAGAAGPGGPAGASEGACAPTELATPP